MPSREGERESEDHGLRDFLLLFIFLFIDEGKRGLFLYVVEAASLDCRLSAGLSGVKLAV